MRLDPEIVTEDGRYVVTVIEEALNLHIIYLAEKEMRDEGEPPLDPRRDKASRAALDLSKHADVRVDYHRDSKRTTVSFPRRGFAENFIEKFGAKRKVAR